ncbi:tyrosine-protein phosphatase [Aliiglaciecola sp. 3_MG-2023]|uniref:tyrosine-protein phosphatase n=1 Tax=Aliiglaciecola sp. 3_MG-2023 TaxID=3062644 RepID=UPI0026E21D02|nr:tyrosine-protein phosphatase [Aliiglaciecola sp. 3_MG-2023]MDO6692873.1 tyrosine-protein phosphatase [Aliiglaciecola sp. 3_MG-2023]
MKKNKFNKPWILFSSMLGLVTVAHAYALEANVNYDTQNQAYHLNWQAESPVTVKAFPVGNENNVILIDSNNSGNEVRWQAPATQRYQFIIEQSNGEAVELRTRVLPFAGGRNFRDLGGFKTKDGKQVKWGKLYRSGAMHNLTSDDYATIRDLGIATVVDFRTPEERASEKTEWQGGEVEHYTWDYAMDFDMESFKSVMNGQPITSEMMEGVMASMYPGILSQQKEHYKAMFDRLVESDEPLVFHCTAGKDRTGISAALILTALDVERDVIIQDYEFTEQVLKPEDLLPPAGHANEPADPMMAKLAKLPKPALAALMGARKSYIQAAFDEMIAQSGSVTAYIEQELEVSPADIEVLKAHFLE